jgi:hypothetical protein
MNFFGIALRQEIFQESKSKSIKINHIKSEVV